MVDIILDPKIRNWVLLPITLVMFFVSLLRHYVTLLMRSPTKPDLELLRNGAVLQRAGILRSSGNYLHESVYQHRRKYFNEKDMGVFSQTIIEAHPELKIDPMKNPMMSDPNMMMGMMKGQMTMIVPNMVMMMWISHFFSGFVMVKLPFSLTPKFKGMLQRGVDMASLDVSYVSSLSWYFLNMMGLRGLLTLVLGGESEADEAKMMQRQMNPAAGMGGQNPQQPDFEKMYAAERENLELHQHEWKLKNVEVGLMSRRYVTGEGWK